MIMDPVSKNERYFTIFVLLSLLLLTLSRVLLDLLPLQLSDDTFLLFHTLLESFRVFVSFSIFIQAWISFSGEQKNPNYFIGTVFFSVGFFDLIHTLTYKGMPFINDEFSVARATWFWVVGRITEGFGIFLAIVFPTKLILNRRVIPVIITSIIVTIISEIILIYPEKLPMLFIDGHGMTTFKVSIEYIVSFILLITFVVLSKKYLSNRTISTFRLLLSIFLLIISELYFTIYTNVYAIEDMIGHIYKFFGYVFFYKLYFSLELRRFYRNESLQR